MTNRFSRLLRTKLSGECPEHRDSLWIFTLNALHFCRRMFYRMSVNIVWCLILSLCWFSYVDFGTRTQRRQWRHCRLMPLSAAWSTFLMGRYSSSRTGEPSPSTKPTGRCVKCKMYLGKMNWELNVKWFLFDFFSLELIKTVDAPASIHSASLHPDKDFFVAGGDDFKLYKYDYSTKEEMGRNVVKNKKTKLIDCLMNIYLFVHAWHYDYFSFRVI